MNISKTSEYAIRVLSYMAIHEDELLSAEALHQKLKIPRNYLRTLLTDLTKKEIIRSSRGRKGGFEFSKNLDEITLFDIISIFEDTNLISTCLLGFSFCALDKPCILHNQWSKIREDFALILKETHLGTLKSSYLLKTENQ